MRREGKKKSFILVSDEHHMLRKLLLKMSKVETEEYTRGNICLLGAKQTQKSLCWVRKWFLRIKYYPYFSATMLGFRQTDSLQDSSTQTEVIQAEALHLQFTEARSTHMDSFYSSADAWGRFTGRCSSSIGGQAGQIPLLWHAISDP